MNTLELVENRHSRTGKKAKKAHLRDWVLFGALWLAVIGGAACSSEQQAIKEIVAKPLGDTEGIIYGAVAPEHYTSDGERVNVKKENNYKYTFIFGKANNVVGKQLTGGGGIYGQILGPSDIRVTPPDDMVFARRLPPGEYSIYIIRYSAAFSPAKSYTDIRFFVKPNVITYIGTLKLKFSGRKGLFGEERPSLSYEITVVDDEKTIKHKLQQLNSALKNGFEKNLMALAR